MKGRGLKHVGIVEVVAFVASQTAGLDKDVLSDRTIKRLVLPHISLVTLVRKSIISGYIFSKDIRMDFH